MSREEVVAMLKRRSTGFSRCSPIYSCKNVSAATEDHPRDQLLPFSQHDEDATLVPLQKVSVLLTTIS